MPAIALTEETFETTIASGIVLVDCWAEWCGPCRRFGPIFEAAADRHPDVVFAKVDTQAEEELAGELGIRSIPTLMIFRDGILLFAQPGMLPAEALDELVAKTRALDMDQVRARIAAGPPDPADDGSR